MWGQVEYPSGWPTFFHDIIQLLVKGRDAVDMFCRILIVLDEDIISLDTPRYPHPGFRLV